MTLRLTNYTRKQIALAILRHRFNDEIVALTADRAALADAVYNEVYSKPERERMASLPAGWLPECYSIRVQFGSSGRSYEVVPFSGVFYDETSKYRAAAVEQQTRRLLSRHVNGCVKVFTEDHPLSLTAVDLKSRLDDIASRASHASRQVDAALASVSTIGRLIEVWPEVEPFAKRFDTSPQKLPAVQTDKLNKLLDLPVAA